MEDLKKGMPYFFDTNAIYYFCGETADKYDIKKFIEDFKDLDYKIMPSCVYQEMLVKFRNNTDELGRKLAILEANNFKISPSQYDYLDDGFTELMSKDLTKAINEQFEKKIDNEARLIYLLIFSITMVVVRVMGFEKNVNNVSAYMKSFTDFHIKPRQFEIIDEIKKRLKKAYNIDDTENEVKRIYVDYTFDLCYKADIFSSALNSYDFENKKPNLTLDDYLSEKNANEILRHEGNFQEYIAKYTKKRPNVIKDALDEIPSFFKKHKYTDEQVNYIKIKLEKLLTCKAKLEKNDIYDIFFMFSYSEYCASSFNLAFGTDVKKEDIVLLSFDTKVKNFIGSFSETSIKIIDSYKR